MINREEWKHWWAELPAWRKYLPIPAAILFCLVFYLIGGLRIDHIIFPTVLLICLYSGRTGTRAFIFLVPFFLAAIIYDSMRYWGDYVRGPIHVVEPYVFEKTFFGISTSQGVLTPNEWWQLHTHPILDFFTGLAYIIFIFVYVITAAYFTFWLPRVGTKKMQGPEIQRQVVGMQWAFLWVNLIGYTTYYWYAAAPPWYVALYGLGPAIMSTPANVAGCARFDLLFGTQIFGQMYGRAADVFGAIPSLHVAYPLIAMVYSFKFGTWRVFSTGFYLLMCFAAVYLNHHYLLDILWGSAYALITLWIMEMKYGQKPQATL